MMRARNSNRKHSSVKLHLERLEDRLAPATLIQSTFDADTEGWTFVGDGTGLTHVVSGGNPGGFVQASDRAAGSVWYWAAPANFLGDQASAYGGNLLFDLAQSAVTSQFNADDVILLGAGQRLVHDLPANPGVDWTSYTVPLEASAWRINSRTGDPASEAQLQTVLGALTALHIRGEYRDGGDTGKLDNVRLESGPEADLEVTISASPDPVFPDDLLTYTITVTNHGPDDANEVTLSTAVPANTTFVSFTPLAGGTSTTPAVGGGGEAASAIAHLVVGAAASFIMVVKVNPSADAGIISQSASTSSNSHDLNPANNIGATTTALKLKATDLRVTWSDLPDPVRIGNDLTYTITVTNAGPVEARGVFVRATTPTHTTFQSVAAPAEWTVSTPNVAATGDITFASVSLAAGASVILTAVVQVASALIDATVITNAVTVAADNPDPSVANNSATATTTVDGLRTDLAVSVTSPDRPEFLQPGSVFHFDILLTNTSANALDVSNVVVTAVTDRAALVESSHPEGWTRLPPPIEIAPRFGYNRFGFGPVAFFDEGAIRFGIPLFPAGAEARFQVTVVVPPVVVPQSTFKFTAFLNADGTDADTSNDRVVLSDTIAYAPNDLAVAAQVTPTGLASPGQVLNYSITVVNNGPVPVNGIVLHDEVRTNETYGNPPAPPKHLTLHGAASQGVVIPVVAYQRGVEQELGPIDWLIGTLAPGALATMNITTTVPEFPGAPNQLDILHVASVGTLRPDPFPFDNVSTQVIELQVPGVGSGLFEYARIEKAVYYISESDPFIPIRITDVSDSVQITYETRDLDAEAGRDYQAASGQGDLFGISLLDNQAHDGHRSFEVSVQATRQNTVTSDRAIVKIFDDEPATTSTVFWNTDRGGRWDDPNNWHTGFVPRSGDKVIIDRPGIDVSVVIPQGDFAVADIRSNETIVVEGGSLTLTGPADIRSLDIKAGGTVTLAGAEPVTIRDSLNNAGALNWTGSGNLNFTDGANFNNLAGGVIDVNPAEPAGIRISNLSNDGTVTIRSGALELAAGLSTGRFDVASGAALNFIGNFAWNNGTTFTGAVRVDPAEPAGSTVSVNGSVSLTNLDVGRFGVLQVAGTLTSAGTINVRGTLSGTGTIRGNVRNAGIVRPGRSPGILTIDSNYTQLPDGLVVLEIGGVTPGVQYDQLKVTGLATLAGSVEVVLVNGFAPRPADRFRALDFAHQTGSLTPTNLAFDFGPGGSLRPLRLTPGAITGFGSLRVRQRDFMFSVYAKAHKNGLSLRGALHYRDVGRRLTLLSTRLTLVQIEANGGRALFQGTARLNGQHGYRFTVWVEDRRRSFTGARDRFRILIEGPAGFRYDSKDYPPLAGTLDRGALQVRPR